jgi:tetratricopeptide (TPR) repeat protein
MTALVMAMQGAYGNDQASVVKHRRVALGWNLLASKGAITMSSSDLRMSALVLLVAFLAQGAARAGDLEDCTGTAADKIEAGCAAILNDQSRSAEDRLKAYVARSRYNAAHVKYDAAATDADAALQLDPKSLPALFARGFARQRLGKFDDALADYNKAIELDPKSAPAMAARGSLKNDQKAWADAIADFGQAITMRQDFAQAYVGRARAYVETGQFDSALGDLNAAVAINPNVPGAFFWRGQAYRRKGDADHALEDFSRAIAQSPQTEIGSYYARGQIFSAKGDYARAIVDFDKVMAISPNSPAAQSAQQQKQTAAAMQTELAKVHGGQTPAAADSKQAAVVPPLRPEHRLRHLPSKASAMPSN